MADDQELKQPAENFHQLQAILKENPNALDDRCDLFKAQPSAIKLPHEIAVEVNALAAAEVDDWHKVELIHSEFDSAAGQLNEQLCGTSEQVLRLADEDPCQGL